MEPLDAAGSPAVAPLTGVAAGVPYVALPPAGGATRAPLVVVWHGLDPSRSRQAMAAALPMARLPAWRTYLRLPMLAAGAPAGGPEERVRPGAEGVVVRLPGPVTEQAVAGFPAVVAALRARLPVDDGPIGLVGWSVGAAVVLLVLAEAAVPVRAAALLRPAVQLERAVAASNRRTGAAGAVAERLDLVARAHQIAARDPQPALLLVLGARDDAGIREPAERLWQTLAGRYRDPGRVGLLVVPDLGDALAEEPGPHPVPRTPGPARVDAAVAGWLDRHLTSKEAS
jgi:predicted esterase